MSIFSSSAGPGSHHRLAAGSVAGGGSYELGPNRLTVGLDGLSGDVSGLIDDSGDGVSLVRVTGWKRESS